jgi:hypothetical protein
MHSVLTDVTLQSQGKAAEATGKCRAGNWSGDPRPVQVLWSWARGQVESKTPRGVRCHCGADSCQGTPGALQSHRPLAFLPRNQSRWCPAEPQKERSLKARWCGLEPSSREDIRDCPKSEPQKQYQFQRQNQGTEAKLLSLLDVNQA